MENLPPMSGIVMDGNGANILFKKTISQSLEGHVAHDVYPRDNLMSS